MTTVQAERICAALRTALEGQCFPARLHSRFREAANLDTPLGLVTLLSPRKCLQPSAVRLEEEMDYTVLEPGVLSLGSRGIAVDGAVAVSFGASRAVDLHLTPGPAPGAEGARMVRQFLAAAPEEGLARLALGRSDGLYAGLLAPRLETLRRAVRAGETETAARAARRMAGCGPGLTPSSDDLICGYLALLPSGGAWAGMAEAIAAAAARGTNDISAALLLRAGEGHFSEDALGLIGCLRRGGERRALHTWLLRVASFGSSSGYDFLTGVYFGVLDACAIGGIRID